MVSPPESRQTEAACGSAIALHGSGSQAAMCQRLMPALPKRVPRLRAASFRGSTACLCTIRQLAPPYHSLPCCTAAAGLPRRHLLPGLGALRQLLEQQEAPSVKQAVPGGHIAFMACSAPAADLQRRGPSTPAVQACEAACDANAPRLTVPGRLPSARSLRCPAVLLSPVDAEWHVLCASSLFANLHPVFILQVMHANLPAGLQLGHLHTRIAALFSLPLASG